MVSDLTQRVLYEFGPFQLDPEKRVLLRAGTPVALTPKVFDMLLFLIGRAGTLVSKEELMNALWPDSHVEESNLTQTVFLLRKALGGTAGNGQYILTLPGRGYRFTAALREVTRDQTAAQEQILAEPSERLVAGYRWWRLATAATLAVCLLAAVGYSWKHRARQAVALAKTTVAVLPFENLTGDPTQDYFTDGLTEELTIQLAHSDPNHLEVLATPPASSDQHGRDRLERIGQTINVQYVLQGSIRRDSNHIRASAKLIRTHEQAYIWTKQYDRELTDPLAFETEIAQDIAEQIRVTLGGNYGPAKPAVTARSSHPNFEAYDLYLKGRYFWNKRTKQSFLQAIDYFDRATKRDPAYARAYAGLADSYALYSGYTLTPPADTMRKARAAADRALALDSNLAEAHASSAVIAQDYEWNWAKAEAEYRRAIALDPTYATAHQWYAEFLGLQGRFNEAFAEMDRARRLDPLSLIIATDHAVLLYYARQFDRSIEQFHSVLEMEPNFPRAHMVIYVYAQKHMLAEALSDIQRYSISDNSFEHWFLQAYAYGLSGRTEQARASIDKLESFYRNGQTDLQPMLLAYAALGDKDRAFACLDQAFAERSSNLTNLKVSPMYDPLRGDARFTRVLRAMQLE